jgi:HK97 gp10 family phage protein
MAVSLSISVTGLDELQAQLDRINPKKNSAMVGRALVKCALLVQSDAAYKKIIAGGRFRGPAGPRGGRGKMTSSKPHPTKLTSRTSRLRDDIAVNRSPLPWAVEVGTDVKYAAVHEYGGRYHPPRPFLGPALDDMADQFDDIFAREIAKEIR